MTDQTNLSAKDAVLAVYPDAKFIGHSSTFIGRIAFWSGITLTDLSGWIDSKYAKKYLVNDDDIEDGAWAAAASRLKPLKEPAKKSSRFRVKLRQRVSWNGTTDRFWCLIDIKEKGFVVLTVHTNYPDSREVVEAYALKLEALNER